MFPALYLPLTNFHPIALLVSERVVACLIAGTVLTACAGLVLKLMTRQSAPTRFVLCLTTLSGVAFVPLLGWRHAQSAVAGQAIGAPLLRLPEEWASYIFVIWAVGAAIALTRVAFGLYRVHQVRRSCVPVESAAIDSNLQLALVNFQSERGAQLCTSELVRVLTAIGFLRPVIALPGWCLRDLSPAELHSVVLHELEHLRRYDDWTNLFQRIVGAVFFFHPAIWWLESRLSLEREMACDDAVLAAVPDPRTYARCLISLAEKSYLRRGLALAQAAVSRVHQLTARVTQILDARRPRATSVWKPALSIAVITILAGSASLEVTPHLVSFQSNASRNALPHDAIAQRTFDNNESAASTVASTRPTGQSLAPLPTAFELRPTPARWVSSTHSQKPGQHVAGKSALPDAENASFRLALAPQRVIAPRRPALNASVEPNAAPLNSGLEREHLDTSVAARASQTSLPTRSASPQMLVMVVHTEQRDESGVVFWSVRVVQLMVFHPPVQDRVIDPQVPAKT
jgi:beta-lactamase regulating signal transducer with metallopeptidase domain